jgi:PleD family two-component response regulator
MNLQKKETILIVDDSKFQRAIIKEMLGEHFHLEEATSGEECLMILEKSSHRLSASQNFESVNPRHYQIK